MVEILQRLHLQLPLCILQKVSEQPDGEHLTIQAYNQEMHPVQISSLRIKDKVDIDISGGLQSPVALELLLSVLSGEFEHVTSSKGTENSHVTIDLPRNTEISTPAHLSERLYVHPGLARLNSAKSQQTTKAGKVIENQLTEMWTGATENQPSAEDAVFSSPDGKAASQDVEERSTTCPLTSSPPPPQNDSPSRALTGSWSPLQSTSPSQSLAGSLPSARTESPSPHRTGSPLSNQTGSPSLSMTGSPALSMTGSSSPPRPGATFLALTGSLPCPSCGKTFSKERSYVLYHYVMTHFREAGFSARVSELLGTLRNGDHGNVSQTAGEDSIASRERCAASDGYVAKALPVRGKVAGNHKPAKGTARLACPVCGRGFSTDKFSAIFKHVCRFHMHCSDVTQVLLDIDEQVWRILPEDRSNLAESSADPPPSLTCPYCRATRTGRALLPHLHRCHFMEPGVSTAWEDVQLQVKGQYKKASNLRVKRFEVERLRDGHRYTCRFCRTAHFKFRSGRLRHEASCQDNASAGPRLSCVVCNRVSRTGPQHEAHLKTHEPRANFVCTQCGRAFKNRSGLFVHTRNAHRDTACESKSTFHKCGECGMEFYLKSRFLTHLASHTDARPFGCPECSAGFKTTESLRRHVRTVHTGAYPHHCGHCGHGFTKKAALITHVCGRVRRRRRPPPNPGPSAGPGGPESGGSVASPSDSLPLPGNGMALLRNGLPLPGNDVALHSDGRMLHGDHMTLRRNCQPLPGDGMALLGNTLPLLGDDMALHRDSRTLPDDHLALHRHSLPLPGDDMTLHRASQTLPEDNLALHRHGLPLPGDDMTLHRDSQTLPEDHLALHRHNLTLPEDDVTLHRDSQTLPEDHVALLRHSLPLPGDDMALHRDSQTLPEDHVALLRHSLPLPGDDMALHRDSQTLPEDHLALLRHSLPLLDDDMSLSRRLAFAMVSELHMDT